MRTSVTPREMELLQLLHARGPLPARDAAFFLKVFRSSLHPMLRKLVERGLLITEPRARGQRRHGQWNYLLSDEARARLLFNPSVDTLITTAVMCGALAPKFRSVLTILAMRMSCERPCAESSCALGARSADSAAPHVQDPVVSPGDGDGLR